MGDSGLSATDRGAGQVVVETPADGVVVYRMKGRMMPSMVEQFDRALEPYRASGRMVDLFFDTATMSGYHPQFRERMTSWHVAVKPQTRSANVFVNSKLLAMAIAVASMVTSGVVKGFADRRAFERTLDEAVRRARVAANP